MRFFEIINERAPAIPDAERLVMIRFLMDWLAGSYMHRRSGDTLPMWQKIHDLFPPRITRPVRLFRLVTLPIQYADKKIFSIARPAPKNVGSWTSVHAGLDSVHGITDEDQPLGDSCRIAIEAKISPENILASHQSLRRAFLSLTHDYVHEEIPQEPVRGDDGRLHYGRPTYRPFLTDNGADDDFHSDLGYYQGLFREMAGGPLRQYEYIVKTTPLEVRNIRVYRRGGDTYYTGNGDPHNSYGRGWVNDRW